MRVLAPLLVGLGVLLAPGVAHAECTTPELPVVGCPLAAPSASPSPSPSPSPSVTPSASPSPSPSASPVGVAPILTPPPIAVAPVGLEALSPVPAPAPAPVVEPPAGAVPVLARPQVAAAAPVAASSPLPGIVASSFALVVFGLLALPLLLGFLAGLRPTSGGTVNTTRTRLWTGLGVLALAAVVGGVGWYRISGEPLLNRQIPFLASAGILVVLLSVLGGALIVAEQLKGDQHRIGELEDAVRALTESLAPMVEQPPRRAELGSDVLQS